VVAVLSGFPSPLWTQIVLIVAALYFLAMTVDLSVRGRL